MALEEFNPSTLVKVKPNQIRGRFFCGSLVYYDSHQPKKYLHPGVYWVTHFTPKFLVLTAAGREIKMPQITDHYYTITGQDTRILTEILMEKTK